MDLSYRDWDSGEPIRGPYPITKKRKDRHLGLWAFVIGLVLGIWF